jgi:ribosome recycling factor
VQAERSPSVGFKRAGSHKRLRRRRPLPVHRGRRLTGLLLAAVTVPAQRLVPLTPRTLGRLSPHVMRDPQRSRSGSLVLDVHPRAQRVVHAWSTNETGEVTPRSWLPPAGVVSQHAAPNLRGCCRDALGDEMIRTPICAVPPVGHDDQEAVRASPEEAQQMIGTMVADAQKAMDHAVDGCKVKLAAIQLPQLTLQTFEKVMVGYSGTPTPVSLLATISIPEPRLAIVLPQDHSLVATMAQAIVKTYPAWGVTNDGTRVTVIPPAVTDTQRLDLVKQALQVAETTKITIRNVSRKAASGLDQAVKDGTAGATEVANAKRTLDHSATNAQERIDVLLKQKTAQLQEV